MVREKNINWQIVVWFSAYFSFEKKGGGLLVSFFPLSLSLRKSFNPYFTKNTIHLSDVAHSLYFEDFVVVDVSF